MKDNYWAIYWFALGLLLFILAAVNAYKGNSDRSIAMIGVSLACHARSEIAVLQKRI